MMGNLRFGVRMPRFHTCLTPGSPGAVKRLKGADSLVLPCKGEKPHSRRKAGWIHTVIILLLLIFSLQICLQTELFETRGNDT